MIDGHVSISDVLGTRLRQLRTLSSLSQEIAAERMGISQTYLSALERGRKFPTAEVLEKIASVFQVEYYELFLNPASVVGIDPLSTDSFVAEFQVAAARFASRWLTNKE